MYTGSHTTITHLEVSTENNEILIKSFAWYSLADVFVYGMQ